MKLVQHYIKKQLLDFEFASKTQALKWQQRVAFQDQLIYEKVIESILEKYEDGKTHKIGKIIIDLGTTSEDQVALKIREELESVLKKIIPNTELNQGILNPDKSTTEAIEIDTIDGKKELLYIFLYFINQGHFPWNISISSISKLEKHLLDQFSISDLVIALRTGKVLHEVMERKRFLYQFSKEFVQAIFPIYFKDVFFQLTTITSFCQKHLEHPRFVSHFSRERKSKKDTATTIIQWITFKASEQETSWLEAYAKWYISKRWISKIPLTYAAVWNAVEQLKYGDNETQIQKCLRRVFRHMDLRLKAYEAEGKFALDSADVQDNEQSSLRNKEDYLEVKNTIDSEPDHILHNKDQIDQILQNQEDQKEKKEIDKSSTKNTIDDAKENIDNALNKEAVQTEESSNLLDKEGVHTPKSEEIVDIPRSMLKDEEANIKKDLPEGKEEAQIKKQESQSERDAFTAAPNELDEKLKTRGDKLFDSEMSFSDRSNNLSFSKEIEEPQEFYPIIEETIDTLANEPYLNQVSNETSSSPSVDYYIKDGGLLLVWPYLHRLFDHLKYTKEKKFVSRELQERAVLLLGYIATGNPICEEHQLVFSKFLCNWPFKIPIRKTFELTAQEEEEVHTMLAGLISHWSILKNTSIDGLRETFFWREGKLQEKEEHWKLTVEQKGTDILLSHLPYGISMIKLPWHKKILRVDWA